MFLLFILATIGAEILPETLSIVGISPNSLIAVNSPFALGMGVSLFLLFNGLRIPHSELINSFAASAFGVYLLTDSPFIRNLLWNSILSYSYQFELTPVSKGAMGLLLYLAMASLFVTIFALCVDSIKRLLVDRLLFKQFDRMPRSLHAFLNSEFGIWQERE